MPDIYHARIRRGPVFCSRLAPSPIRRGSTGGDDVMAKICAWRVNLLRRCPKGCLR